MYLLCIYQEFGQANLMFWFKAQSSLHTTIPVAAKEK